MKFYNVTLHDLYTGKDYDVNGTELGASATPTVIRFGPRAIMNFRIRLPKLDLRPKEDQKVFGLLPQPGPTAAIPSFVQS